MNLKFAHPKNFFTISEVAESIGISVDTLRRLEARGQIKPRRSRRSRGKRVFTTDDITILKRLYDKSYDPDEVLLPIKEAAKWLGVSIDTLRRWERSGKLTSVRTPGGHRRYRLSSVKFAKSQPITIYGQTAKERVVEKILHVYHHHFSPKLEIPELYQSLHIDQKRVLKTTGLTLAILLLLLGIKTFASSDLFREPSLSGPFRARPSVLQAQTANEEVILGVNVRAIFRKGVNFGQGLTTTEITNTGLTSLTDVDISGALDLAGDLDVGGDIAGGDITSSGDLTLAGDLAVNGGDITTTATTFNLLNTTATTINFGAAATTLSLGATSGTTTINNNLTLTGNLDINGSGTHDIAGTLNLSGNKLTSSGDLTLDLGGGDLILADGDVINIGGSGSDVAFNVIGDSTSGASASMTSDDDLYVEGNLEVDGSFVGTITGTLNPGLTEGSVLFQGPSAIAGDSTNFFWDDTNNVLRMGSGTVIRPSVDIGADLGTASFRWNNIYAANLTIDSGFTSSGQLLVTYNPTDTTFAQSSIRVNVTTPAANEQMLGIGQAGEERAAIDAEGDLTLGYDGAAGSSIPVSSDPFNVYGHSTLRVASIDTTGNYNMFGPKSQTTISNIVDVFVYDTTADSDGGAWTNGDSAKASSWYNETIDNTGTACVIATDDRCGQKEFPKRAVIEADASNVRIYNAEDQTMWLRFSQGADLAIGADTNNDPQTVFALNGRIYIGTSGSSTTGLYVIDLKADTIRRYNATNRSLSDQRVSGRNSTNTYTAESTILKLPSAVINDVKAASIESSDYIAVGTNGGSTGAVSLIQEENKKIANFGHTTATVAAKNVFLLSDGTLYYTYRDQNSLANDKLKVNYAADKKMPVDANIGAINNIPADVVYGNVSSTNRGVAFGDATAVATAVTNPDFAPGPTFPDSTPVVNDVFVTKGTSTADPGRSNTIYLATDDGMVRIDEYQSQIGSFADKSSNPYTNYGYSINETKGSVKYYTKDYISDSMYGDIRGMWGLNNNTASDLEDLSVQGNTLTNAGSVTFTASGVRGNAATFTAGANQYLQKSGATSLQPAATVSVGAWVNPSSTTQKQVIMGQSGDLTSKSYRLGLHGTTPYFEVSENGSDTYVATASASLTANSWNHVAGVFRPSDRNQGGSLDLYVNGASVAHSTNAPNRLYNRADATHSSGDFRLGNDNQNHTNVSGTLSSGTVVTVSGANKIFGTGDFINVRNTTAGTSTQTVITAAGAASLTVLDSLGSASDSVLIAKVNYGNVVFSTGNASTTVSEGPSQEDFMIGDLVEVYDASGTTAKIQTVISAVSETNITMLTAGNATADDRYFVKLNTTTPKFGTALDATFKIITGPNQNEFSVGDVVQVSSAIDAAAAPTTTTLTVVTAVASGTITTLDTVGSAATNDSWTVKVNKYTPVNGTSINFPTSTTITGPNSTQFAIGDLVEVGRAPDAGLITHKTQTTVTAATSTDITVADAISGAAATTDDTKVSKLSVSSTPTEYFAGKIDDVFVTATSLTADQVRTMFYTGQAALQNHTGSRITGVTGADSYQQLAGAGTSAATVNAVNAVAVDDKNQFLFVGTNDSSANTGGVSVLGVHTDTLHDLYDDTNNTTKDDDTGAQFDATDVVALSIHGPEPQYLAIAGTNDTTTKMWLESSNTSLKSHIANNVDPHGTFLNQTNLKVDNTLVLGESGEANLTAAGDDVRLTGNFTISGSTVFQGAVMPNSSQPSFRNLFTGDTIFLGGQYNSMALGSDNLPRIVSYDSGLGELYYIRCLKTDCSSYSTQLLDDGDPDIENDAVGEGAKIVIGPDNLPYIAYRNDTQTGLYYIRCLDQDCNNRVKRMIDIEDNVAGESVILQGVLSLAVNSRGFPVFAYPDDTLNRIRVATCNDMDCNQVTVRQIGENGTDIGNNIAMALDSNDNPVFAYQDVTATPDLWVTACTTPDCSSFSTSVVAATANNVGNDLSIAIGTDDLPRIVHRDFTATNYYFIKCTTSNCSSITPAAPGLLLDADGTSDTGPVGKTTIAMDGSNNSYIAYWESATAGGGVGNMLTFVQVDNTPAISSGPTQIDDVTDTVGNYPWIGLTSSGNPVIAHRNVTQTGIRLTNCGNSTCTSGNTSQDIFSHFDGSAALGPPERPFDMAFGNDNFSRIVLYDGAGLNLIYVRCLDLNCTGMVVTTVDSTGDVGDDPRIAIGQDGFARIAYRDTTNTVLKYARCTDNDCTSANIKAFVDDDFSSAAFTETNTGLGNSIVIGKDGFVRMATLGSTTSFSSIFVRCLNDDCTAFHTNPAADTACTTVQREGAMVLDPNDFGTVILACFNGTNTFVQYAHCSDIDCAKKDTAAAGTSVKTGTGYMQGLRMVWSPLTNSPIITYQQNTLTPEFIVCTDYKTCAADSEILSVGANNDIVYGLAIDKNTQLPVIMIGNSSNQIVILRCTDPYCNTQTTTGTYTLWPAYSSRFTGYGLIRYVDGQTQYVISYANNTSLGHFVVSSTIDLGSYEHPFGAIFASKIISKSTTVTGFDLAEGYVSTEPLSAGEVVSFDLEAAKTVRKASSPYDSRLAGVVSTDPGLLLEDPQSKENTYPIALAGRVPVKIAPESEPVAIGDKLTSSTRAGMAKKATQAGYVIGNALETWLPPCEGDELDANRCTLNAKDKIEVFVQVGFHEPELAFSNAGDIKIVREDQSASESAISENLPADATPQPLPAGQNLKEVIYKIIRTTADGGEEVIERFGTFTELIAANIKAGAIAVQDLTVSETLISPVIETNLISPVPGEDLVIKLESDHTETQNSKFKIQNSNGEDLASIDAEGNANFEGDATISGTLFASKIYTDEIVAKNGQISISYEDLLAQLTAVEEDQNALSEQITNSTVGNLSDDLESSVLGSLTAANLFVTERATVENLSATKSIAIGTDLILQSTVNSEQQTANSIDTLSYPLHLQSLALAPLYIMAGKVQIDTNGNVIIAGDLLVGGSTTTLGLTTSKVTIAEDSTAGSAIIPAEELEITIENLNVQKDSLIYITPTSSTENQVLYVKEKSEGSFTVGFTETLETDVEFNWWLIDVQNTDPTF